MYGRNVRFQEPSSAWPRSVIPRCPVPGAASRPARPSRGWPPGWPGWGAARARSSPALGQAPPPPSFPRTHRRPRAIPAARFPPPWPSARCTAPPVAGSRLRAACQGCGSGRSPPETPTDNSSPRNSRQKTPPVRRTYPRKNPRAGARSPRYEDTAGLGSGAWDALWPACRSGRRSAASRAPPPLRQTARPPAPCQTDRDSSRETPPVFCHRRIGSKTARAPARRSRAGCKQTPPAGRNSVGSPHREAQRRRRSMGRHRNPAARRPYRRGSHPLPSSWPSGFWAAVASGARHLFFG